METYPLYEIILIHDPKHIEKRCLNRSCLYFESSGNPKTYSLEEGRKERIAGKLENDVNYYENVLIHLLQ